MTVKLIAVGDLKEKYLREALEEYKKRLGAWAKVEELSLKEERLGDNPSQAQIKSALASEEKRILEKISPKAYVIAMCVEGKQLSSTELAKKLETVASSGYSEIVFLIGSSYGMSEGLKQRADFRLSVSLLTFPHQLLRVILAEAVYRAFTIINGTKYHK
ncbi:MAG: 23S rRNA (pseudouridine(1915)-N(3))-methyltransferase RlmH [Clostridia bacterium]|nr:23S rRNA (pseudouridine(1915)-N(3))-methyltransferase RlmH [Clostridia bacterium]